MKLFHSLSDEELIAMLKQGAVGVLPTDTIFGIVASAANQEAVERLYAAKHREGKPGTMMAASTEQLLDLGIDQRYLDIVRDLWPNPLSIVLPAPERLAYLHQGMNSLAVRVPSNPEVLALLQQTGPLLTSSANLPGEPAAETVEDARAYFGENVDFYVEGDTAGRAPSTVARLNEDGTLEVLRQGAVSIPTKE